MVFILVSCSEKQEQIKPTVSVLSEMVYASAIVVPLNEYVVYPENQGVIEELMIREGDVVQKGQVLARIKQVNSELQNRDAQLALEAAEENIEGPSNLLESIVQEMDQLRAQIQLDSLNLVRQQNLWGQGIGARVELDNRKLKYKLGLKQLAALKIRYDQTERDLTSRVSTARNAVKRSSVNLSDFTIRAKMDGQVFSLNKELGERIGVQEPLAKIGSKGAFIIELQIDEVDVARVDTGQQVIVSLDAYEGEVFEAKIVQIFPEKNARNQTFQVEAHFTQPPEKLFSGLSGEANILLRRREQVLSIPFEYLLDGNQVLTQDGAVAVKIGMRNLDRVEILTGIDTSTVILKPQS